MMMMLGQMSVVFVLSKDIFVFRLSSFVFLFKADTLNSKLFDTLNGKL